MLGMVDDTGYTSPFINITKSSGYRSGSIRQEQFALFFGPSIVQIGAN